MTDAPMQRFTWDAESFCMPAEDGRWVLLSDAVAHAAEVARAARRKALEDAANALPLPDPDIEHDRYDLGSQYNRGQDDGIEFARKRIRAMMEETHD